MRSLLPSSDLRTAARVTAAAVATAAFIGTVLLAPPAAGADDGLAEPDKAKLPVLRGTVGHAFVIDISEESVPAGRYKLVVRDRNVIHNFHITGRGVDERTSVPFEGRKVWKIDLREGTYRIQCDAHSASIFTFLEVTPAVTPAGA